MADANMSVIEAAAAVGAKLLPGIAGSVVALRWMPPETTRLDRIIVAVGGVAAAAYVGPMLADVFGVTGPGAQGGLMFVVGLFGMTVAGQLMLAIKEVGLGSILGAWLRKFLGVGG